MSWDVRILNGLVCYGVAIIFAIGLLHLGVRLKEVQIDDSAEYSLASDRQSLRRVKLAGLRGRIIDRHGAALADNRVSTSIVCMPEHFQCRSWSGTVDRIERAIASVGERIGCKTTVDRKMIKRHVRESLAMPLFVWRDIGPDQLAIFCEHAASYEGFEVIETGERIYPNRSLAAHAIGFVGRDSGIAIAGDIRYHYAVNELCGRSGLELFYDGYLRGVSGEKKVLVDARGFAIKEWIASKPMPGPTLRLTIDVNIQRVVERELKDSIGACAVIDPRNGDVLALASAPTFDLNIFVPILRTEVYERFANDSNKPLLNRASGGAYAPGSIFKPITALAGLRSGFGDETEYCCCGVYQLGEMSLRCASRWGHGELTMRRALMKSCNPFFCNLAHTIGTNALITAARDFGLGTKSGIDLGIDMAGNVPTAEWKLKTYRERWYQADLVQMAIGQGMLLVSPLQMARVAGAVGTGRLVTPRLNSLIAVESSKLPFTETQLKVVRDGMRMVVAGDGESRGTGWRGGDRVAVSVSGKTGTAEVGRGESRHNNTWFMAYAPSEAPSIAIAMVIENGDSGGGTTAPKVRNVLAHVFGER